MTKNYKLEEVYEDADNYLFIKNLNLASAIKTAGASLRKVKCNGDQCVFVFNKSDKNLQKKNDYKNYKLTVDAKRVLDERRFLVSEIKN